MNSGNEEIWTWPGPATDPLCDPCSSFLSLDCVILHEARVELDDREGSSSTSFLRCGSKLGKELVWGCLGPEAPRRSTGGWTTGERKGEAIAEHARTCL